MDLAIYASRIGLVGFAAATILFATEIKDKGPTRTLAFAMLAVATFATLGTLVVDFIEHQRILHAGILLSGLIGLMALISETKFRLRFAGPIASPLATLLLIFELIKGQSTNVLAPGTPLFLSLHVGAAVLGELAGVVSFIVAVMYLWQQRSLKQRNLKVLSNLPSLETLSAMLHRSVITGFIFLSITLVSGAGFATESTRNFGTGKLLWAISVWGWYLLIMISRNYLGKSVKMQAKWAIVGFLLQFFALYALL